MLAVRAVRGGPGKEAALARADMPWLAGAVLAGGVIGPVLLMIGLSSTPASSAALLLNLEGLATMGIAWVVVRENVDRRLLMGAFAILGGAVVLSWNGGAWGGAGLGAILIAGACLAWGVDNNLTRKISGADPLQITAVKGVVAGLINVGIAVAQGASMPPPFIYRRSRPGGAARLWRQFDLLRPSSTPPGCSENRSLLLDRSIRRRCSGCLLYLSHEAVTPWLALAAGLMAFGVWLHLTEDHRHEHAHEALEHEHAHIHDDHHQHDHALETPPGEPHTHRHRHRPLIHSHGHFPDLHHRHDHP